MISVGQKRKAEEDSPNPPPPPLSELEPLEQVCKAREELGALLTSDKKNGAVNCDIEQNIREIRAILKMNAEIFDRCMKFMTSASEKWTSFARIRFEVVQVRERRRETQFITRPIRDKLSFATTPLSILPKDLDDIIVKHNMTEEKLKCFIDFEKFFDKSLILHEVVLEPFLPKLKEHLMTIQVCLGKIDEWAIQQPQIAIRFLEATFSTKMGIPDDSVQLGQHTCTCLAAHDYYEICLHCGKPYGSHCDDNILRFTSDSVGSNRRCEKGSFAGFQCEVYQVLKNCRVKGKHETSFDITNANEQTRLKKFLEFIAIEN